MGILSGKFAIITGAASKNGLGKATAKLFAEHGATVAILDLNLDQAIEAAADLGTQHIGLACNVVKEEDCQIAVATLLEKWERIDILVNNAGITQPLKIMDIKGENYDAVLDVNLRGTLLMSQAVIPAMRTQKTGSIVNISSVSAQRGGGVFGGPHYSAAKAGVLGLTKAMARELAPSNIRSNAICPGFIGTDITAGKMDDAMYAKVMEGIPMARAGKAEEVAGCCLFLASDLSSYVTGSEVDVNGGSLIH
ncbi:SDR family NAD(P)-dependent oxidoreductase [Marinomonas foliarum]|jgi:NAD(P)-dependent dehydrogenase (short-subunit alcohol dehydrogenase family)|uniref:NAD(P)-dependent dehydrogenase (Short-subunit alcohol dehydrogenase family) n=1 Tax=Marinomonas foliarum TaxID=491950 RepID=A0A368ZXU6_9GAMM|nr:SDR family NAD(P)-dependent oxidoreductase [Marinomonas foliarum]RCX00004.1 NAD(P)-dependent dehydrogenase (short-subunit alcohol dehydrogenase family) [Marinomonas foliarum]